ncbi:hypothetical protein [Streptomyces sp. NPDC048603]|uniref:hypothetical protein n=1 Tax=Streptomyces sp. NPDC048603 TaxID=3365577 RepID=UPI003713D0B3
MTPLVLHLRPGAREWFTTRQAGHHPLLVPPYERTYAGGPYAPARYRRRITRQVHYPVVEFDISPAGAGRPPTSRRPSGRPDPSRTLTLL